MAPQTLLQARRAAAEAAEFCYRPFAGAAALPAWAAAPAVVAALAAAHALVVKALPTAADPAPLYRQVPGGGRTITIRKNRCALVPVAHAVAGLGCPRCAAALLDGAHSSCREPHPPVRTGASTPSFAGAGSLS